MSEELKEVKSETQITDDSDKISYSKKTFKEYHEKKLEEENTENNTNFDCEYRVVTNILTKITKKIRECI